MEWMERYTVVSAHKIQHVCVFGADKQREEHTRHSLKLHRKTNAASDKQNPPFHVYIRCCACQYVHTHTHTHTHTQNFNTSWGNADSCFDWHHSYPVPERASQITLNDSFALIRLISVQWSRVNDLYRVGDAKYDRLTKVTHYKFSIHYCQ